MPIRSSKSTSSTPSKFILLRLTTVDLAIVYLLIPSFKSARYAEKNLLTNLFFFNSASIVVHSNSVLITTPFHPGYATAEVIAKAKNLKLCITAGVGSDHIDLNAANAKKISVMEVTGCVLISASFYIQFSVVFCGYYSIFDDLTDFSRRVSSFRQIKRRFCRWARSHDYARSCPKFRSRPWANHAR